MPKKTDPEKIKTRPDLSDMEWLVWLDLQPENCGIDVHALYRQMCDWAFRSGKTPSRLRLLNWLSREREAVPMTYTPPAAADPGRPSAEPLPELPDCAHCGNERFVKEIIDPGAQFEWARSRMVPCPVCNHPPAGRQ